MSCNEHVIHFLPSKIKYVFNNLENVKEVKSKSLKAKHLTWYSLLNPAFSFRDIFVICAFIFLTGMFLLVGGPRFVFSGRAYVVSLMSLVFDLQPKINKN